MSRERDAIHDMIEEREDTIGQYNREIDSLYEKYDWQATHAGVRELNDAIQELYREILLLKIVLMRADA